MSQSPDPDTRNTAVRLPNRSLDDAFDALADRRRRAVLSSLAARDGPVAESDLAEAVVARLEGKPRADVTDSERQHAANRLRHVDLPKLATADMVRCDDDRQTVAGTAHAIFDRPEFDALGRDGTDGATPETVGTNPDAVDDVLTALRHERRRTVLSVLRDGDRRDLSTLAERIAERETDAEPTDDARSAADARPAADTRPAADACPTAEEVRSVHVSLRQVHAPTLARAGLVEFDPADGTVARRDHPALDERWLRGGNNRAE